VFGVQRLNLGFRRLPTRGLWSGRGRAQSGNSLACHARIGIFLRLPRASLAAAAATTTAAATAASATATATANYSPLVVLNPTSGNGNNSNSGSGGSFRSTWRRCGCLFCGACNAACAGGLSFAPLHLINELSLPLVVLV
jgi:hypothetical protein